MTFSKFGHGDDLDEWSRKIHDLIDEMHNRSFVDFRDKGTWQPATDVYETREVFLVCVDLAGMKPDEVNIECPNARQIQISGCRDNPRPTDIQGPLSVHVMEIDHGPFFREVDLPEPVDIEATEATYDKGYLWIKLPRVTKR